MIPNEAVEAAAKATQEVCETFDPGGWTEEENWAIWARRILEAASPHLIQAGYDEGYRKACEDIIAVKPTSGPTPYRKTAHGDH